MGLGCIQFLTQSPQVSWSAGGRWKRLFGNGLLPQESSVRLRIFNFFTVNSQSTKSNFFPLPQISLGDHPLTKKPEDPGYEIGMH